MTGKRKSRWPGRFWEPFDVDWHLWTPPVEEHYLFFEGSRLATQEEIALFSPDFSVIDTTGPAVGSGRGAPGVPKRRRFIDPLGEVIYFGSLAQPTKPKESQ
jgi:hypothetical protein